jgi:hypothetical protein
MSDILHQSSYSILKIFEHVQMKENCMSASYGKVKFVTGLVSFVFWGTEFV